LAEKDRSALQLDQNRIVIRERNYLDILDLALRVIRVYAWPLAVAFACGAVPAACLNAWLLADYAQYDFELGFPASYMWYMLLLMVLEMPLVTAPVTLYLGEALFTQRPRPAEIARRFFRSLPQLLFFQLFLRSLLMPLAFSWLLLSGSLELFAGVTSFFLLIAWSVFLVAWPYLGEVILLERNPMRRKRPGQMTTNRRRRLLHAGYAGELFSRWMGSLGIGSLLLLSFWLSFWLAGGMLLNEWQWSGTPYTFCFPLAMWLVVGYFSVVRFLSYLDLRIRREGWEVELMMRAEQARLTRQLT
jgi:hypothetical protein